MLFKRKAEAEDLCVLQISTSVLQAQGTVISDQNAASDYVRFLHPTQWKLLDFDAIFALDWRHPGDQIAYWRHRAKKCAEVLVPNRVPPSNILGAYVVDATTCQKLLAAGFAQPVALNPALFFK